MKRTEERITREVLCLQCGECRGGERLFRHHPCFLTEPDIGNSHFALKVIEDNCIAALISLPDSAVEYSEDAGIDGYSVRRVFCRYGRVRRNVIIFGHWE